MTKARLESFVDAKYAYAVIGVYLAYYAHLISQGFGVTWLSALTRLLP